MSASSICQGLRSCLEPCLLESRVLRLKLAPPGSSLSPPSASPSITNNVGKNYEPVMKTDQNADEGSWAFLLSLADNSRCNKSEEETEKIYVHPTVKRSSSVLSEKSLEMCTESLGCETGSNASNSDEEIALFSSESDKTSFTIHTQKVHRNSASKRMNRSNGGFPPPLTSMTDLGGVQVKHHRENGRLILKAETTSSSQPVFQAERSNGRLRLRILNSYSSVYSECGDRESDDEEEAEIQSEEVRVEESIEEEGGELGGNSEIVEGEMEKRNIGRPSSCKEGGNRNKVIWEPFLVARFSIIFLFYFF